MEATGPLISPAFLDFSWKQETLRFRHQDRLLLFTDGIEDVGGEQGVFRPGSGSLKRLHRNREGGVRLLDQILSSVREFTGGRRIQDDLTLLTADLGSTALPPEGSGQTKEIAAFQQDR